MGMTSTMPSTTAKIDPPTATMAPPELITSTVPVSPAGHGRVVTVGGRAVTLSVSERPTATTVAMGTGTQVRSRQTVTGRVGTITGPTTTVTVWTVRPRCRRGSGPLPE